MRILKPISGAALLAMAALGYVGLAEASPFRLPWGGDGHRMATRAAHDILPAAVPAFFRQSGDHLIYLSSEPDRWRDGELREMDEAWKYDHYIDLENVPPGALQSSDRFEFLAALFQAGVQRPQQTVGFLPFRILELYQRLTNGFARWRLSQDGLTRQYIQSRILNDAGILGHYVVDAAQPHHTTIHFNGWAQGAPNPRGFTTDRDFHSRFESAFVRAHVRLEDVTRGMPVAPSPLEDVRAAVWEHVRESNATVERLYELEKAHGFRPEEGPHPEALAFTVSRLTAGAEMLAAVWWTAWLESQDVARRLQAEGWSP